MAVDDFGALMALATASVLEVAAYYIPGVDHVLDIVATPATLIAGAVTSACSDGGHPAGHHVAGGHYRWGWRRWRHECYERPRASENRPLFTAGLANPVVSTGETAGAIGVSIAAIVVPLLCLLALVVVFILVGRRMSRMIFRESI